jgi:glycosyltransferase involved in cell wall biosynthesis
LHIAFARVVGSSTTRRALYLTRALRASVSGRVDLVFTRDLGVAALLMRLPRRRRPPLVYEAHGVAAVVGASLDVLLSTGRVASPAKQRRLLAREHRVWVGADGYVTITATLAEDLATRFGPRDNVAVVPDGTRLPDGRTFSPPRATSSPLVVYAGHLYPWKGVDTLVRALALVPDSRGLIIGGHPAEDDLARLRNLAGALGLAARVTFTGLLQPADVPAHLASADVLALPNSATAVSARYTSPLKLFEYLAAGKPVVASDLPALREVLRDGENAFLVPADDPAALAAAVVRLRDDSALATRLARTAFDQAADYTWSARAARLEPVLDGAVARVQATPGAR